MEALERQLQQLNKELEALRSELKRARTAYVEALGTPKEVATREIWQELTSEKEKLLDQRQSLHDKLGGPGVTTFLNLLKHSSEVCWV